MITILLYAIPIACISWTITQEEIFKEFKNWCKHNQICNNLLGRKLFYLPTCEYCFSHWVSFIFVIVFNIRFLKTSIWGGLIAVFTLVAITNVYISIYLLIRKLIKLINKLSN